MTSVREIVVACAHITVLPRLRDTETRWVAGGWSVVKLSLQFCTGVTSFVKVKVQLSGFKLVHVINHIERQTRASLGFERTAAFLYPAYICAVGT